MRRIDSRLGAVGALGLFLTSIAARTQVPSPEALLSMVHEQSKQLEPIERAEVLNELSIAATGVNRKASGEWAVEMYDLATNRMNRPEKWEQMTCAAQRKNALTVLSFTDPAGAAQRFFDLEPSAGHLPDEDPRVDLSRHLFVRLWEKDAQPSLPLIRRLSDFTAKTGEYPYAAMGTLIPEVARVNRREARTLFAEAVRHMRDEPRIHRTLGAYVNFLRGSWPTAARKQRREAVKAGVLRVEQTVHDGERTGGRFYFEYYASRDRVRLEGEAIARIYELLPFVDEADAMLGKQLRDRYPRLKDLEVGPVDKIPWRAGVFAAPGRDTPELVQRAFDRHHLMFLKAWAQEDANRAAAIALAVKDQTVRETALALVLPSYARVNQSQAEAWQAELARYATQSGPSLEFLVALSEADFRSGYAEDARRLARQAWKRGVTQLNGKTGVESLGELQKLEDICGHYWFGDESWYAEMSRIPDAAARLKLLASYTRGAVRSRDGYQEPT